MLAQHHGQALGDVRSRPGSFRFPQFNCEPLAAGISSLGIRYEFLGETLGGRPADPSVYREDGLVDYAARRRSPDFVAGLERAIALSHTPVVAPMCPEEDPLQSPPFRRISPATMGR